MYSDAFLARLRLSRRFKDCCKLLRRIWAFDTAPPFDAFWKGRQIAILVKENDLKEDLEAVCRLCNISINNDNLLLVWACVRYPRGIRYITDFQKINKPPLTNDQELENRAVAYALLVKYLRFQMQERLPAEKIYDPSLDQRIDEITDWLEQNGYGPFTRDVTQRARRYFENYRLESLAYDLLKMKKEDNANMRQREMVRSYIWWRNRQRGLAYSQIADKYGEPDSNIVNKAVLKYDKEHGSLAEVESHLTRIEADELWMDVLKKERLAPWERLPKTDLWDWEDYIRSYRQDRFKK